MQQVDALTYKDFLLAAIRPKFEGGPLMLFLPCSYLHEKDAIRLRDWLTRVLDGDSKWDRPTLEAVLKGLRSENDSTQLRAIIAEVESMISAERT